MNTVSIHGIKKIYILIKRQIADSVQPKEKTKASFMLFTGDIPKTKQHRKVERRAGQDVA